MRWLYRLFVWLMDGGILAEEFMRQFPGYDKNKKQYLFNDGSGPRWIEATECE